MKRKFLQIGLIAALVLVGQAGAQAKQFNQRQFLEPGLQSKVNTAQARGFRDNKNSGNLLGGRNENVGCGGLTVGDFSGAKRPPREVIIVADDIVNINKNCR